MLYQSFKKSPLTLDSSHLSVVVGDLDIPNDPPFDEFDQLFYPANILGIYGDGAQGSKPRNGHIRDALVNSALDETLARTIFQSILSRKGHNALPLEALKLTSYGGGQFGDGAYQDLRTLSATSAARGCLYGITGTITAMS